MFLTFLFDKIIKSADFKLILKSVFSFIKTYAIFVTTFIKSLSAAGVQGLLRVLRVLGNDSVLPQISMEKYYVI